MTAPDILREILSICTRARLSAEVIDLLKAKVTVLAEKVAALDLEVAQLQKENTQLKIENTQFSHQLQNVPPRRKLSVEEAAVIAALARNYRDMTVEEIAHEIRRSETATLHFCDELGADGLIARVRFRGQYRRVDGPDWGFELTPEGRKWAARQEPNSPV